MCPGLYCHPVMYVLCGRSGATFDDVVTEKATVVREVRDLFKETI
jgi:hypothetical protein